MRTCRTLVTASLLVAIACASGSRDGPSEGTWVGTITTEGDVTTAVNESGSVWGGPATLVEEASIGVEAGEEPYLLGEVVGVGATDERIFVLDAQVLRVRVYDLDGAHLMDLGGEGDGPGEFRRPTSMAVGHDRVYVRDPRLGRITVFSTAGELVDTWPTQPYYTSVPMVATMDGRLYLPFRGGMTPWGPEGQAGPTVSYPELQDRSATMSLRITEAIEGYSAGAMLGRAVPFRPRATFAMAPTGAVIHGEGDPYRFRIERPDGNVIQVEAAADPVPVTDAEADWHRSRVFAYFRQADPGWQWDGPEIPEAKPAFNGLVPTVSGEIWVVRPGPGYQDSDCPADIPTQDPPESCWRDTRIVEAFGVEGRLLGSVELPEQMRLEPRPFIRGDMVIGVVQDDAGTIMVRRYRLMPPAASGR